jgi:hypothetical protein
VSALLATEEAIFFLFALVLAPIGFAFGTIGSGFALLGDRSRALGASLIVAGAGMALFGVYGVVAAIATTAAGGNLGWQRTVEAVVLPVTLSALVGGAASGLFFLYRAGRRSVA